MYYLCARSHYSAIKEVGYTKLTSCIESPRNAPPTVSSPSCYTQGFFTIIFHQWFCHYHAPIISSLLCSINSFLVRWTEHFPLLEAYSNLFTVETFFPVHTTLRKCLHTEYTQMKAKTVIQFFFLTCSEDVACTCEHAFYSEMHKWQWSGTRENQYSLQDLQAYFKECTPHTCTRITG